MRPSCTPFSPFMAVLLYLAQADNTEGNLKVESQSLFVSDFVAFYGIKHVCLVGEETNKSGVKAMSLIAGSTPLSYFSIIQTGIGFNRQDQQLSTSVNNVNITTQTIMLAISSCNGLIVFNLASATDQDLFKKVRIPGTVINSLAMIFGNHFVPERVVTTNESNKSKSTLFRGSDTRKRWLLISNRRFHELLKPVYLPLNNKLTVANFSQDGSSASLWESYQVDPQFPQRVVHVGRWTNARPSSTHLTFTPPHSQSHSPLSNNSQNQIQNDKEEPVSEKEGGAETGNKASFRIHSTVSNGVEVRTKHLRFGVLEAPVDDPHLRRQDLTGVHLRCTTMQLPPMTMLENNIDGSVTVHGITGKFFDTMKSIMNFTYTCHAVKDGQFGAFVDGEWTGLMKEVIQGVANISVGNLAITQQRNSAVDFLIGTISAGFRIVMKRPSNEDYIWTVYTKQFQAAVWGMALLMLAVLSATLYLVIRRSPQEDDLTLSDIFITTVGFILGQGTPLIFRTPPALIIVLTLLMLQLVLLAYYTSNLTSALTVGPPLPPYNRLQDVHDDRSLTLGFLKGSAIRDQFLASKIPVYRAVGRSVKDDDLVPSYAAGMERVYREKYALMIWDISYTMNYGQDCRTFMLPESYLPIHTSFALAKDSPLTPVMNKVVLDIKSSGIMTKWWKELTVKKKDCSALETAPIILKTVLTPFLLLVLAIVVSLFVLLFERLGFPSQDRRSWSKPVRNI
ncbi:probable glutamate receptor [Penaeus vannamei]|uniref:probable glutamate receptor n=1 Tax=Penaeus vannamei TaxID=6689 RepID=UPI00387FAD0D